MLKLEVLLFLAENGMGWNVGALVGGVADGFDIDGRLYAIGGRHWDPSISWDECGALIEAFRARGGLVTIRSGEHAYAGVSAKASAFTATIAQQVGPHCAVCFKTMICEAIYRALGGTEKEIQEGK